MKAGVWIVIIIIVIVVLGGWWYLSSYQAEAPTGGSEAPAGDTVVPAGSGGDLPTSESTGGTADSPVANAETAVLAAVGDYTGDGGSYPQL